MEDTGLIDIMVEDIVVFKIALVDIKHVGTRLMLVQLASAHHSSASRYPLFFLAIVEMLRNISHRVLHIYKIYNTD